MSYIGEKIKKIESYDIVHGNPIYTDDIADDDALVVKILRSPHPHAKIVDIDTTVAKKVPGVEDIFTYKDVPKTRFTLAGQSYPEPSPYDMLILDQVVRYVGDEVAIIAAKDERSALKAMKLIKVKYELLPYVTDASEALKGDVQIHSDDTFFNLPSEIDGHDVKKNLVSKIDMNFGEDIEKVLKNSDIVVEESYHTQAQEQSMMETFRSYSYMDKGQRLVVVSSTQVPFHIRRQLARALEIPISKIRVIKPAVGGGFGAKQTSVTEIYPAFVTLKTGKKAKIVYTRKETASCTNSRHQMKIKVRIGATKDGIIEAIDIDAISDQGAYGVHGFTTSGLVGDKTLPIYSHIKSGHFLAKVVYTNKMPAAAFRGYGATQGTFAVESTVNILAHKLNMDPIELRMKNIVRENDVTTAYNQKINSCNLDKCIQRAKEIISWDEKYPSYKVSENKIRAVGMAVTMQGSGIANIDCSTVIVKLNEGGDYTLLMSPTDTGTGSNTILTQMAAEVLQTDMDNITPIIADTDITPFDPGSYASSGTYVTGSAVVKACQDLNEKILNAASKLMQEDKDDLEIKSGKIIGKNNKAMTVEELSLSITSKGEPTLTGTGSFQSPISPPPYMAGAAEVEVDLETGETKVVNFAGVVDCGTVINYNLARVQTEGGIVQGIGYALTEEVKYDEKGRNLTNSFFTYHIPTMKEAGNVKVEFEQSYEPTGPFGAKSIGEVVVNTPAPAIMDAIYNATGVRITSLPATSEKLYMAMKEKNRKNK